MFVETKNAKWYKTLGGGREEGIVLTITFTMDNVDSRLKADILTCPKLITAQKNCSSK